MRITNVNFIVSGLAIIMGLAFVSFGLWYSVIDLILFVQSLGLPFKIKDIVFLSCNTLISIFGGLFVWSKIRLIGFLIVEK